MDAYGDVSSPGACVNVDARGVGVHARRCKLDVESGKSRRVDVNLEGNRKQATLRAP